MKKSIRNVAILVMAAAALSACGGSQGGASNTKLEGSFIASEKVAGAYGEGSFNARVYQINLFKGNVYEMIETELAYGYSMVLGTTSVISYGTFAKGASEDGVASYTLNSASEVIMNSYSKAGGY
ncbi:MAG: hypothetical protein MJ147_10785, partial [Clostridia bacterium]|nr:hypothetical protein [Clostridia bacterium]